MAMIQTNTCRYCRGTKALAARQLPQSVGSGGGGGVGVIVTGRPGAGPGVTGVTVIMMPRRGPTARLWHRSASQ